MAILSAGATGMGARRSSWMVGLVADVEKAAANVENKYRGDGQHHTGV